MGHCLIFYSILLIGSVFSCAVWSGATEKVISEVTVPFEQKTIFQLHSSHYKFRNPFAVFKPTIAVSFKRLCLDCLFVIFFLLSCWSTRDHIGRSTRNSNPVMTSSVGSAKGCSDHRFRAPPTYTAQLLTLHQHRANNQYRTANRI